MTHFEIMLELMGGLQNDFKQVKQLREELQAYEPSTEMKVLRDKIKASKFGKSNDRDSENEWKTLLKNTAIDAVFSQVNDWEIKKRGNKASGSISDHLKSIRMASTMYLFDCGNAGDPVEKASYQPNGDGSIPNSVRIGQFMPLPEEGDLDQTGNVIDPIPFFVPLDMGGVEVVSGREGRTEALDGLYVAVFRLIKDAPLGKLKLKILSPFYSATAAGISNIYSEPVVSDTRKLEDHLDELLDEWRHNHRNSPGVSITGPHQVLVIEDFPNGYAPQSRDKIERLMRMARFPDFMVFLHSSVMDLSMNRGWEGPKVEIPRAQLIAQGGKFIMQGSVVKDFPFRADACSGPGFIREALLYMKDIPSRDTELGECSYDDLLQKSGISSKRAGSTEMGIRAPLGVSKSGSIISLELGEEKPSHALAIGGTGSGKSSLLHLILTSLFKDYSPEELKAYLVDLKGGVEFKRYAAYQIPHAEVVAIDCDREFAVSTMEAVVTEMESRMNAFRSIGAGVIGVPAYRQEVGVLPRVLLVMDEYQKLFEEQDELADRARSLFERLLKEGRGFGIHLLLVSQSLKGMSFKGGSLDQIAARIVLRCTQEDASYALAPGNKAGKDLKPYHGIYNDLLGSTDGNKSFKATYLSPKQAFEHLEAISADIDSENPARKRVIFEGGLATSIFDSSSFSELRSKKPQSELARYPVFFGEPVEIRPTTHTWLYPSRGRNLISLIPSVDSGVAVLLNALLSLKAAGAFESQQPIVMNFLRGGDSENLKKYITGLIPEDYLLEDDRDVERAFDGWLEELENRNSSKNSIPPRIMCTLGLQHSRALRFEVGFGQPSLDTPLGKWFKLLREGPEAGLHQLVWCDRLSNLSRTSKGLLSEFGVRACGSLNRSESIEVLGSVKAAMLKNKSRGVLYDEDQPEMIQTFRPFSCPDQKDFLKMWNAI